MSRTQFRTFTGLMVDPFEMTEGDIRVEDIARSQSLCNRYNGHSNFPYSVAQHEILLSDAAPKLALAEGYIRTQYEYRCTAQAAFAHDWSETYVQDIITPIKHRLKFENMTFNELEECIQKLIFMKFSIPWEFMELIVQYDKRIFEDEAKVLKPCHVPGTLKPLGVIIEEWKDWRETEQLFYQTLRNLELNDAKPQ